MMKCVCIKPLMRRRNIARLGIISLGLVILLQSHLFSSNPSTWLSALNILISNDRLPRQEFLATVPLYTGKDGIEQAQNDMAPALSKEVIRTTLKTSKEKREDEENHEKPDAGDTKGMEQTLKTSKEKREDEEKHEKPDAGDTKGMEDPKYLVYLCEAKRLCGGWGDRQRGFASVYILALLTNRQFRIVMKRPCDIADFYAPVKVPWIADETELRTDSTITLRVFSNKTMLHIIRELDFNTVFPQKVVYMKTNRDLYLPMRHNRHLRKKLEKWGLSDSIATFRWAWRQLMQPTEKLLSHVEHQIGPQILMRKGLTSKPAQEIHYRNSSNDIGNSNLICAHVRLCRNPTIPMDSKVMKFRPQDVPPLFGFMISQDDGNSRYFVATDSEEIRKRAHDFFREKSVAYEGDILHIDMQADNDNACSGFEVALAEQLILSLCDILVLSDSTFGRHAAYMSSNTSVYSMVEGKAHFKYRTDGPIV